MAKILNFKHTKSNGKTYIEFDGKPKKIEGRTGLVDIETEYADVDIYSLDETDTLKQSKKKEYKDILDKFQYTKMKGKIILDTETDSIEVIGRTNGIRNLEKSKGLKYEREVVWLNGGESTSGIIVLPHDDYDKVYVIEGTDADNPQDIKFIDEYQEGMERPYYKKINGETHIYVNHFSGGGGTQTDPYLIHTRADLEALANNYDAHYKLMNDLDLSDAQWTPLPTTDPLGSEFNGSFDGNGCVISNMTVRIPSGATNRAGLFETVSTGSVITKLGLENVDIISNYHYVGGLAGIIWNCTVHECYVTGRVEIVGDFERGAGMGGYVSTTEFKHCYTNVNLITGTRSRYGGFTGYISGDLPIIECLAVGTITSNNSYNLTGGFYGDYNTNLSLNFSNCYFDKERAGTTVHSTFGGLKPETTYNLQNNITLDSTYYNYNNGSYPTLKTFQDIVANIKTYTVNAYSNIVETTNSKLFSKFQTVKSFTKNITSKARKGLKLSLDIKSYTNKIFSRSGYGSTKFVNVLPFIKPITSKSDRNVLVEKAVNSFIKPIYSNVTRFLLNVRRPKSTVQNIFSGTSKIGVLNKVLNAFVKQITANSIGSKVFTMLVNVTSTIGAIKSNSRLGVKMIAKSVVNKITGLSRKANMVKVMKSYVKKIRSKAGEPRRFYRVAQSSTSVIVGVVKKSFKLPKGRFQEIVGYITYKLTKTFTRIHFMNGKNDSNTTKTNVGDDKDGS